MCRDRSAEGFFAVECNTDFVACHAGQVTIMQCPSGLVYDEDKQVIAFIGHVIVKGSQRVSLSFLELSKLI